MIGCRGPLIGMIEVFPDKFPIKGARSSVWRLIIKFFIRRWNFKLNWQNFCRKTKHKGLSSSLQKIHYVFNYLERSKGERFNHKFSITNFVHLCVSDIRKHRSILFLQLFPLWVYFGRLFLLFAFLIGF